MRQEEDADFLLICGEIWETLVQGNCQYSEVVPSSAPMLKIRSLHKNRNLLPCIPTIFFN